MAITKKLTKKAKWIQENCDSNEYLFSKSENAVFGHNIPMGGGLIASGFICNIYEKPKRNTI